MITLADLLFITNDSTWVRIKDSDDTEILAEGEASDLEYEVEDEYGDAIVMDQYPDEGRLVICIEV